MSFDYKKNLETAFKNHIFSTTDPVERKKEIILRALKIMAEKKKSISGFLRFQSPSQKLLQSITQSLEIKTGDMLEEFFDSLLASKYKKLKKSITYKGKKYECDQLVKDTTNNSIILIEQKIRDNHDSTKKIGQADNFEEKIIAISETYKLHVKAYEWFIDDQYKKYPGYYQNRIDAFLNKHSDICTAELIYGESLIESLIGPGSWQDFVNAYNSVKINFISNISRDIEYDFDNDPDTVVFNYFIKKRIQSFSVFFDDVYLEIRNAYFPNGVMAKKLFEYFSEKKHLKSKTSEQYRMKYSDYYGGK